MPAVQTQPAPVLDGVLFNVLQQLRQASSTPGGLVVAFSSACPGEGVTYVVEALLASLGRDTTGRTLVVDSRKLRLDTTPPAQLEQRCRPTSQGSVFEFVPAPSPAGAVNDWDASWEHRRDSIDALRDCFDYVLVDCPALREGSDVLSLAPFVDGILLVVEADRTRRDQIIQAEKSIAFARGKLLGHILNKRRYIVPDWIYRRL